MKLIFDVIAWLIYKCIVIALISIVFFLMVLSFQWASNTITQESLPTLTMQIEQQLNKPIAITLNNTVISSLEVACTTVSGIANRLDQSTKQFLNRLEPPNPFLNPIDYFFWKKGESIFITQQNALISSFNEQTDECNKVLSRQRKINQQKIQEIQTQTTEFTNKIKGIRATIKLSGHANTQMMKELDDLRTQRQQLAEERGKHEKIIADTSQENEKHKQTLKMWEIQIADLSRKINGLNDGIIRVQGKEPHSTLEFFEHRRWKNELNQMIGELDAVKQHYGQLISAKIQLEQASAMITDENEKRSKVFPLIEMQIATLTEKIKKLRGDLKEQNALIIELDILRAQRQQLAIEQNQLEQTLIDSSLQLSKVTNHLENNDLFWISYQLFINSIFLLVFFILFGNFIKKSFWYFIIARLASTASPLQVLK
ncbi:hypothetical protein BegalDRAFT_1805 [Beggiatoa alba B18LD]|uniref:Uncharacterized protein n=1 Tax=Beggiatoa alba B18LD TaxID=395493 RepID=I3CGD6_9GAMM|nr:hypothetical protein [Beggiatoa alba]EIJ42679.1 hypothetical protein BegalDRAFT_1805 [Beggiatoa alba B18LD]